MASNSIDTFRRTVLSAIAIPFLGGCLSRDESRPGLADLFVRNLRHAETTVTVTVRKDDELVYEAEHLLEAATEDIVDGVEVAGPWLGESASYEVVVDVPAVERNTYTTDDFLEMAGDTSNIDCFGVTASIEPELIDFFPGVRENCSTDR